MKVLHLTLQKKWFDMIASGKKKEEYREIKRYWEIRLFSQTYDVIEFRNGYGIHAPAVVVELLSIHVGQGETDWGAPANTDVYVLRLGNILLSK